MHERFKKRQGRMLLGEKVYGEFNGREASGHLPELCLELLTQQKRTWPFLRKGYESLRQGTERHVSCKGFSVLLQHNPGRMKSTMAAVGEQDISRRPCFLCLPHLPEEQKGVLYRSTHLILGNPMPVFPAHFTIAHINHRPQAISVHVDSLLQLMADFGPGWALLYNGPKCGASAPDHFHFQAVPSGRMPVENEIREKGRITLITQNHDVALYRAKRIGREVIVIGGGSPTAVGGAFKAFLKVLKHVLNARQEPMINLIGLYKEATWRLVVFPRRKHRPDAFFRPGEARVAVSPAVVEMGGIFVTPFEKDFERLDAAAIEAIFEEVSLERPSVDRAIDAIRSTL